MTMNEWENTPWAGSIPESKALTIPQPPTIKAAYGAGVAAIETLPPLHAFGGSQQQRMASYLKAYKVGWFYKAERKISSDIAMLKVNLSPEDTAGDNETAIVAPDPFTPLEMLSPVDQFLRLMEHPNPHQTGRQLRQKLQIRIDMAGAGFLYLDSPDPVFGLPRALYGISPSRMWPSFAKDGTLIGWVMDLEKDGRRNDNPVPFAADEILPFITGSAEDGIWGVGVVEAVYAQVPLTDLMAKHTADVLSTGGRMAGMAWPKDRALEEGEFQDAQRAWRNVVTDPNAAKRLLLFPEPMEYVAGSSTPAEIGIPELAALNRDEIVTAFPISPYQLGVPMPGGLNSGETRKEDRRDYWEGTIHPRVEMLEDVLQVGLVSRYEKATGQALDVDIEEPNLDDAASLLEKGGALRVLVNLGFDEKEVVAAVGLDHIKFNGVPQAPTPVEGEQPSGNGLEIRVNDSNRRDQTATSQKLVSAKALRTERDDVLIPAEKRAKQAMQTFFADQRARTIEKIRAVWPAKKDARKALSPDDWWAQALEVEAMQDALSGIYVSIGRGTSQVVADTLERIVTPAVQRTVIDDLLESGGERITEITETTRKAIAEELATGIQRGYSLNQIIDGYLPEKYQGIQNVLMDNGTPVFGDLRAETIARTESALAYNRAALTGYKAYEVTKVQAIDGDKDAECADRDGKVFSIDDAYGIADHPNGTLDWSPLLN